MLVEYAQRHLATAVLAAGLIVVLAGVGPVAAQSTVTLKPIDLEGKKAGATDDEVAIMDECLETPDKCRDPKLKAGTTLTLEDVVNIGVIDHDMVRKTKNGQTASKEPLPSIDMEILFDYDSDTIRPDQYRKLGILAQVLAKPKYAKHRFGFFGHTDAKGSDPYNMELSRRRAAAVARFVQATTGLSAQRFIATGLGERSLKTPDDPYGPDNRRVQLMLLPGS